MNNTSSIDWNCVVITQLFKLCYNTNPSYVDIMLFCAIVVMLLLIMLFIMVMYYLILEIIDNKKYNIKNKGPHNLNNITQYYYEFIHESSLTYIWFITGQFMVAILLFASMILIPIGYVLLYKFGLVMNVLKYVFITQLIFIDFSLYVMIAILDYRINSNPLPIIKNSKSIE